MPLMTTKCDFSLAYQTSHLPKTVLFSNCAKQLNAQIPAVTSLAWCPRTVSAATTSAAMSTATLTTAFKIKINQTLATTATLGAVTATPPTIVAFREAITTETKTTTTK